MSCASRHERDTESTTPNILNTFKEKIDETFSEKNINNLMDQLNIFTDKAKDVGDKMFKNIQDAFNLEKPESK